MLINSGQRTDIPAFYSAWFLNRLAAASVLVRNPFYRGQLTRYRLDPSVVDCLLFCSKNPGPLLDAIGAAPAPRIQEAAGCPGPAPAAAALDLNPAGHGLDAAAAGPAETEAAALLARFRQYWFVTITPYSADIEPYVPPVPEAAAQLKRLSAYLESLHRADPREHAPGADAVCWRCDPVAITETYTLDFHAEAFRHMAAELAGWTHECVISFIDLYAKTRRNFPEGRVLREDEMRTLAAAFGKAGRENGIAVRTCAETADLSEYGIGRSGCVSREVLERVLMAEGTVPRGGQPGAALRGEGSAGTDAADLCTAGDARCRGRRLKIPAGRPMRPACGCVPSHDIGDYNSCLHGCRYCYANYDRAAVLRNVALHDDSSPLLIGWPAEGESIHDAVQKSWIADSVEQPPLLF